MDTAAEIEQGDGDKCRKLARGIPDSPSMSIGNAMEAKEKNEEKNGVNAAQLNGIGLRRRRTRMCYDSISGESETRRAVIPMHCGDGGNLQDARVQGTGLPYERRQDHAENRRISGRFGGSSASVTMDNVMKLVYFSIESTPFPIPTGILRRF
ncbi:hypothetical protein EV356DRAFT_280573 [Viridothelium virens]|uniref:Uncharacterized protein n=1 Tax=Viridothelium virens TaxID=1048519 RepID=A0A6A6H1E7_VIRVR|nr:hypothetical protein EV356DRAFT_280573 [Viridothelium virens]